MAKDCACCVNIPKDNTKIHVAMATTAGRLQGLQADTAVVNDIERDIFDS